MFRGAAWGHARGATGYVGLALVVGGTAVLGLTVWLLEPHKALRHALHRVRHHARKLGPVRREPPTPMSDEEFDALEDQVDREVAD